jgi:hypothetical protein
MDKSSSDIDRGKRDFRTFFLVAGCIVSFVSLYSNTAGEVGFADFILRFPLGVFVIAYTGIVAGELASGPDKPSYPIGIIYVVLLSFFLLS